jgi:hypothetical protein
MAIIMMVMKLHMMDIIMKTATAANADKNDEDVVYDNDDD